MELEIEFDIIDSVVPSSGVFNVKLAKSNKNGLGITVNGSTHGSFIITDVKPGSPAHRTGSLRSGDILLAVDNLPLQHYNVDLLLKENKNECTTLTIKRNCLPDFLFDTQQRNNVYNLDGNSDDNKYKYLTKLNDMRIDDGQNFKIPTASPIGNSSEYFHINSHQENAGNATIAQIRRPFFSRMTEMNTANRMLDNEIQNLDPDLEDPYNDPEFYSIEYPPRLPGYAIFLNNIRDILILTYSFSRFTSRNLESSIYVSATPTQMIIVRLESNGGPLGITLAGSEDQQKPILISSLADNGVAQKNGQLRIGDQLLAINGESVQGTPLSNATKLLQKNLDSPIELKISRSLATNQNESNFNDTNTSTLPPQPVYAQIQRRPRSPSVMDSISNNSREGKFRTIQVMLYKDKVYDDYGFSLSDGLYEKGVFINRIRSGGPADMTGVLKPYDRIMQVIQLCQFFQIEFKY